MKKLIVTAAALLTSLCLAQPPGITREMIERSLPLEGAPLAVPGPYKVASEPAFGAFPGADALPKLHGPVLLINGGEPDFMLATSKETFDAINNLPAFYGSRHNAGHTATVFHPGGGEFANVASNWLLWTLKGDKKAGKMFAGKNCALCTNSNWDVKSKGI
jgi:hypothetical protein